MWRLLESLVKVPDLLRSLGLILSPIVIDTGSGRFRGRVAVHSFQTSVAMLLGQVMYTSSVIMACYDTHWRSRKKFVEGGGFGPPLSPEP